MLDAILYFFVLCYGLLALGFWWRLTEKTNKDRRGQTLGFQLTLIICDLAMAAFWWMVLLARKGYALAEER